MRPLHSLVRDRNGGSAAEFALVLPLFIILLLGILDAGRLLFDLNQLRKAVQVGTRMAVVTSPVAPGLATASYVGVDPGTGVLLTQGDVIPAGALGRVTCTETSCVCTTAPCPPLGAHDATAFGKVLARMQAHYPAITPSNVTISYLGSGLGFAGDPNGPDISPTVEVQVSGLLFTPVTSLLIASVPFPDVRTSMTGEDQSGEASY